MDTNMTIKFWGVRGSHPVPGSETVRYGGNTPCVEVTLGSRTIILDAGTGIIPLGRALLQRSRQNGMPLQLVLLLSHMHHDHLQGFPFFAPAFLVSTRLHVFGPDIFEHEVANLLSRTMAPPFFPITLKELNAAKTIRCLPESQAIQWGAGEPQVVPAGWGVEKAAGGGPDAVRIRALRSYAHPGGVLVYRLEWQGRSLVYATDTEGYANTDQRLVTFAQGADLLIHDAQYMNEHYLGLNGFQSTQGWGHSTARMACDVARAAGVKRLALFHYDPRYADGAVDQVEAEAQAQFPAAFAAREGQELVLEAGLAPLVNLPRRQPVEAQGKML